LKNEKGTTKLWENKWYSPERYQVKEKRVDQRRKAELVVAITPVRELASKTSLRFC
jgi:hypothetical protein